MGQVGGAAKRRPRAGLLAFVTIAVTTVALIRFAPGERKRTILPVAEQEPIVRPTIDDLLSQARDFDIVNAVYLRLGQASQSVGARPSRDVELVITLTWEAHGLIGNGGFESLYGSAFLDDDPGFTKTIAAFRQIGLEDVAKVFEETKSWFPGSALPTDLDERSRVFKAVPKKMRDEAYDRTWQGRKALPKHLADFIRANKVEIEGILAGYETRKRALEGKSLVPDSSWDIGNQPVKEVIPELLIRLNSLPPGGVLVLVANHPGEALVPDSKREGKVDITTDDYLRQFCGNAGHVVVKVDPPCYWIRRRETQ